MAGILTIGQSDGGGPAGRTPIIPLGHSRARFPRILPQGLYIRVIYKPGQLVVTSGGYTRPWSCCAKVPAVTPGLYYKLGKYCCDFGEIAFSGIQGTITLVMRGGFCTYDGLEGTRLCEGELLPSRNHRLGAYWDYDGSLRFAKISGAEGQLTIGIY